MPEPTNRVARAEPTDARRHSSRHPELGAWTIIIRMSNGELCEVDLMIAPVRRFARLLAIRSPESSWIIRRFGTLRIGIRLIV